ncbi:hypothetical protein M409DRAFT_26883 [Zasmidium cellare ATCC 36951]|uniref:2EXR domain-containing protein n=1 Tax=Zasmidium cellare ATCC 36951 TaxID=1080233 RepID=A0A6A6C9S3_ZASCE|nr:uncharacterized protein M409DRAFT_26883 [Zasmidium cellare ATCC 36951]KAF2162642.1 hypothetical protein M409DRAFT_26883 [Zasmidium cellare ATCC 36951]
MATTIHTNRLLTLPPELRNKVYTLTLIQPTAIQISERSTAPSTAAQGATLHYNRLIEPALLFSCRQIRFEALPIFYGENVFFTALKDAIAPWLLAIGPAKAGMVRHVWGFRPSRYFDYAWAKGLAGGIERELAKAGCGLGGGVFRMPFGCERFPGKVFWTSGEADVVFVSEEGCIGHARGAFRVKGGVDGAVDFIPVKAVDG